MPPTKRRTDGFFLIWNKSTDQVAAHHSDAEIGDVPEATPWKFDIEAEHDWF